MSWWATRACGLYSTRSRLLGVPLRPLVVQVGVLLGVGLELEPLEVSSRP